MEVPNIQFLLSYRQLLRKYVDRLILYNQAPIKNAIEEEGFSKEYYEHMLNGPLDNALFDFAISDSERFRNANGKEHFGTPEKEDIDGSKLTGFLEEYIDLYIGRRVNLKK